MEEDTQGGKENANDRNHGTQPLDAVMNQLGVTNHALVAASALPLTHKAVQRARKGRWLTPHMRRRIAEALEAWCTAKEQARSFSERDLFNYEGNQPSAERD